MDETVLDHLENNYVDHSDMAWTTEFTDFLLALGVDPYMSYAKFKAAVDAVQESPQ